MCPRSLIYLRCMHFADVGIPNPRCIPFSNIATEFFSCSERINKFAGFQIVYCHCSRDFVDFIEANKIISLNLSLLKGVLNWI